MIGAEGRIGGYTLLAEWRSPQGSPPKDPDFALVLGPIVVTPDELDPAAAPIVVRSDGSERSVPSCLPSTGSGGRLAASGTTLRPGDVLAGPALLPSLPPPARSSSTSTASASSPSSPRDAPRPRLGRDGHRADTLHMAIERFGDLEVFHAMEAEIGRELTLHEVIAIEMETVTAPLDEVVGWLLENVCVRAGFAELVAAHDPLIVSAGFHELIEPVLAREGVAARWSRTASRPTRRAGVPSSLPHAGAPSAASRASASAVGDLRPFAYVGDGVSDRCVSLAAERVFARDGLARWLDGHGVPYEPFDDLHDVRA